jgi:hypothetical protein
MELNIVLLVLSLLALPILFGATVVKITNAGRDIITNLLSGLGGTVPKYVGWGTGATGALETATSLSTESGDETPRATGTPTRQVITHANDTYQVVGTMTVATNPKTITNAGLFDADAAGNLFMLASFTGLALDVGDSIEFTFKAQFTGTD